MKPYAVLAALAVALSPAVASGQGASSVAAAEALFKEARDLIAAGHFAEACPKLAESERLDPGAGTLLNLATCYEKNGQIASAWATYKLAESAASQASEPPRVKAARARAAALEARLPTLSIVVPPAADRPDLAVARDGETVGRAAWATPIPVDAGPHVVRATAPGRRPWQAEVVVLGAGAGARASVEVPLLEPEAVTPEHVVAAPPADAAARAPIEGPSPAPSGDAPGRGQRLLGLVVGGAGLVGLVIGAGYGVAAKSTNQGIGNNCGVGVCNQQGLASDQQARTDATDATIAFAAGGAVLVGGALLYLLAPSRPAAVGVAPAVGPSFAGVALGGTWR